VKNHAHTLTWQVAVLVAALLPAYVGAEVYDLPAPGNDVIGALTTATSRADDTLLEIARRHGLGYEEIVRANPDVDPWLPGEGTDVVLPTRYVLPPGPRSGVVLNLAEYRMYYFPVPAAGEVATVLTYPISIGRMDWETPLGRTTVVSKMRNPSWYPPASIRAEHEADGNPLPRVVPPGPDNPLGNYAMRLGLPGYLIHGTNRPSGVGMRVTHGCIRMFPEDIDYLFGLVATNTPVRIINDPVKVGWDGDALVVEVHQTLGVPAPDAEDMPVESINAESDDSEADARGVDTLNAERDSDMMVMPARNALTELTEKYVLATSERVAKLDWAMAENLLEKADGIPAVIGQEVLQVAEPVPEIKDAATSAASE